jgi:hypothetical protein
VPRTQRCPNGAFDLPDETFVKFVSFAHLEEEEDALVLVLCSALADTQGVIYRGGELLKDVVYLA